MKIKFDFEDNLPLNKKLNFNNMIITIRYFFKGDDDLQELSI